MPARSRRLPAAVLATALVGLALNLRIGIAAVGPVLPTVIRDLRADRVQGSLLTALPVVMMGVMSPWSSRLAARVGVEWTAVLALLVVALASAARWWTASSLMLLATAVVLGAGIAAGNTMLPAFVGRHFPATTALMTGVYTVAINMGAGSAAYATPRLAAGLGSTWRGALAVWAVPALVAAVMWTRVALRLPHRVAPARTVAAAGPRRVVMVAILFGLQSTAYYGVLTWLAPAYEERGWTAARAGLLVAFFTTSQIAGSIGAALAVQATGRLVGGLRVTAGMFGGALLLVALTPASAPWLWATGLGVGSGGVFTLAMTVPLRVSDSLDGTRVLTGRMLCYGYLLAAVGPFAVGVLRSASGSFLVPFLLLAALCAGVMAVARTAARPA